MKKEYGMAMRSFLKSRDYKTASKGLKKLYGESKEWDSFLDSARSWGFKWSQIHFLKELCNTYRVESKFELQLIILHFLHQYDLGNLRTSISSIERDISEWYPDVTEDFSLDVKTLIESYPGLFGTEYQPFLVINGFIYINRIKRYEESFLELLEERLQYKGNSDIELDEVYQYVNSVSPYGLDDLGKEIIQKALDSSFLIISGGPGTGKTTTVVSIIKALRFTGVEHIAIAAPTGRAAKRVVESIIRDTAGSSGEEDWEAFTLHKLLGIIPGKETPRYNRERPLPMDVVIVDEASMVDIHMMYRLFDALKPETKLILVGDKDQLPSVEAGALLGDFLYGYESSNHKMKNQIVVLNRSFRSIKGIMDGAKRVISGDTEKSLDYFKNGAEELKYYPLPNSDDLLTLILEQFNIPKYSGFGVPLSDWKDVYDQIAEYFNCFNRLTILSPTRKGPLGTWVLNTTLKREFCHDFSEFYHGQPVMITRNDYVNNLYNGDRGVVFKFLNGMYAFFPEGNGFSIISVSKLNDYETSYAGTVHKSQGSEYDKVIFIVPEGAERLLTREIIYTALTRAKQEVVVLGSDDELKLAISRVISRESGIRDFLMN